MNDATARLTNLDVNRELDELLDNMRHVTENLKEFTATIKTRRTRIRASNPREHKTGEEEQHLDNEKPNYFCGRSFAMYRESYNGCGARRGQ